MVNEYPTGDAIALSITGTLLNEGSIKIGYKIPYDGYIEFHLYDANDKKVWITSWVKDKGEYYLAINRTKLEAGMEYRFDFIYKGKKFTGKFVNA